MFKRFDEVSVEDSKFDDFWEELAFKDGADVTMRNVTLPEKVDMSVVLRRSATTVSGNMCDRCSFLMSRRICGIRTNCRRKRMQCGGKFRRRRCCGIKPGIKSRERSVAAERPEIKDEPRRTVWLRAVEIRLGRQVGKY